jgi:hypothetical protein
MARRRKPGRKPKPGRRTKCGRLSRAYKDPEIRDHGTEEFVAKRLALVNGGAPELSATASGILLANGCITNEQHSACQRYAWAHALSYGRAWGQVCPLGDPVGWQHTDTMVEIAKDRLAKMDHRLSKPERLRVANLAVFGFLPQWFYIERGIGRRMPEDERERQELLAGLDAISDRFE